jgi:hypothetical protein
MQLAFSNIVVGPYFDAITEIFPKFLNVSDIVLSNIVKLTSLLSEKTTNTVSPTSSPAPQLNLRRMSVASGTIDIPQHLMDLINNGEAKQTKFSKSLNIRRLSLDRYKNSRTNWANYPNDTKDDISECIDEYDETENSNYSGSIIELGNNPVFEKLK